MLADIKKDFPALKQNINGKPLVFLDSGASAQTPLTTIETVSNFYKQDYANVHRGVYQLSERATAAYEASRTKVQKFINAATTKEIIFTKGTTESINLIATSFGNSFENGDEVIISAMEHHANIVPWQLLQQRVAIKLKIIPINSKGELELAEYKKLFSDKTKLVSIVHTSNVLGTINPVKEIIEIAHQHKVPVLLDGAQSIVHEDIDVQALNCDFFTFSSHKLYGPTGVGVLYGKQELLEQMPPYQGGGDMIKEVCFEKTQFADLPLKFEAGTPNIAGIIGLGATIDYLNQLDRAAIYQYEQELLQYAEQELQKLPGLNIIGQAKDKAALISFTLAGIHPHDIGSLLDHVGIAVRVGHHCAMPIMQYFKIPATVRASFAMYNSKADVDALVRELKKIQEMFA